LVDKSEELTVGLRNIYRPHTLFTEALRRVFWHLLYLTERGKGGRPMRRTLLLSTMVLTLLLASGAALAVNKVGTDGPDTLRGTNGTDDLSGKGGGDRLISLAGNDKLSGGPGNDYLDGGPGSDTVSGDEGPDFLFDTAEGVRNSSDSLSGGDGDDWLLPRDVPAGEDAVSCGSGTDVVSADRADVIADDCEYVFFQYPEG
jgi:hypothetical protein